MKIKSAYILSYAFPPFKSNSRRTYYITQEFKKHFNKVVVITSSNRNEKPIDSNIHTAFTLDYRTLRGLRNKKKQYLKEKSKSNNAFSIYKLFNSFPFNILIGEGGLLYIINSYRIFKKQYNKKEKAIILSSFRPYADHIIGYLIKKKYKNIIWIADFRDLHLDPILKWHYFHRFQLYCNSYFLKKADLVTTVSQGLAEHLTQFNDKVVVLRNGIGLSKNEDIISQEFISELDESKNYFKISYTGSMFRDLRDPTALLEALSNLIKKQLIDREKIRIVYAGKDTSTWTPYLKKYDLSKIFISKGIIKQNEARLIQKQTQLNLLLTYSSKQLKGNATGKVYEYLVAEKPILALIKGEKDLELEEIIQNNKVGVVVYANNIGIEEIEKYVYKKYLEWLNKGDTLTPGDSSKSISKYYWDNMISDFLKENNFLN